MARNPLKKSEPAPQPEQEPELPPLPPKETGGAPGVQVIERPINIGLINEKLNYITGLLIKVAEACEVDLD